MAKSKIKLRSLYPHPDDLRKKIDGYFDECEENTYFATFAGLVRFLELDHRDDLMDHIDTRGYSDAIRYAVLRIEELYERRASLLKNPSGPIFILKAFGWDKGLLPLREEKIEDKRSNKVTVEIVMPNDHN